MAVGLAALVVALAATAAAIRPPAGVTTAECTAINGTVFRDRCYTLNSTGFISWTAASTFCTNRGLTLPSIRDNAENTFVRDFAGFAGGVWIGLSDTASEGNWVYTDGTQHAFQNWAVNQPDNAGSDEDCVHYFASSYQWNDLPCVGHGSYPVDKVVCYAYILSTPQQCADSGRGFFNGSRPNCYSSTATTGSFDAMRTACNSLVPGSELAWYDGADEVALHAALLGSNFFGYAWFGLTEQYNNAGPSNGKSVCESGPTSTAAKASTCWVYTRGGGASTAYRAWGSGEPGNSGAHDTEDCAMTSIVAPHLTDWIDNVCSASGRGHCKSVLKLGDAVITAPASSASVPNEFTFSFTLGAACDEVRIVFSPVGAGPVVTVTLDSTKRALGANSLTLRAGNLASSAGVQSSSHTSLSTGAYNVQLAVRQQAVSGMTLPQVESLVTTSVNVAADATDPTFLTGPQATGTTNQSTTITATLSEAATVYCVALGTSASAPAASSVRSLSVAGQLASGSAASSPGSPFSVSVSLSPLAEKTTYHVYCVAEDASANVQDAATGPVVLTTLDLTPPAPSSALTVTAATGPTAALTIGYPELTRLYCVAVLDGAASYTTGAQVKAAAEAALSDPVKARFVSAAGGASTHTVSLTGLQRATNYDVFCAAEDNPAPAKLRALDNTQGSPSQSNLFSQGCLAGNASVLVPTFQAAQSSIADPNLVAAWRSSRHYASHAFAFRDATNTAVCNLGTTNTGSAVSAPWSYAPSATSCDDTWTFTTPLTTALAVCGFSAAIDDSVATEYRATVDVTTVENGTGLVFGVPTNTTRVTSTVLGIRFPKQVNISTTVSAFGSVIAFAAVTSQQVNTASGNNVTLALATSVQHPYELAPLGSANSTQTMQSVSGSASRNLCSGTAECTQEFELALSPQASTCALDTDVTQVFTVRCRAGFTGSCDLPAPAQTSVTFRVVTDNFCARVVEVASITPTLRVYSTPAGRDAEGAQATDATSNAQLFYRVDGVPEGGLAVTSVTLLDVEVRSFCTGCVDRVYPVRNGVTNSTAAADYGFVIGAVAGSRRDFQFTINDESISFDNDDPSGQVQVQVTVGALVNYTEPSGQQASKRVQLQAAVPGSSQVSASARFGVSSSGQGSAPASTSGQATVLGLAPGVAMAAGVGLAAVVALAVGAALVARRRRGSRRSAKLSSTAARSSSSASLFAPQRESQASTVPLGSLQNVQEAYGHVQA